jgi:nucleoside-specific outer membrane channel protein Tsx
MSKFLPFILLLFIELYANEQQDETSLSYLYGTGFDKVLNSDTVTTGGMSTLTLDYSKQTTYIHHRLFTDMTSAQFGSVADDNTTDALVGDKVFFEYSPTLDISKLFNLSLDLYFFKELHLAGQIERSNNYYARLAGLGFLLDMPFIDYLETNIYWRDDNFNLSSWQFSIFWKTEFTLGIPFIFEGFFDVYGTDAGTNVISQPRLLTELSPLHPSLKNLQVGAELYYYKASDPLLPNVEGKAVELTPQLMIKWIW